MTIPNPSAELLFRTPSNPEHVPFNGFPESCFEFFAMLEQHNNRTWFDSMRDACSAQVISPAQAFIAAMGTALKPLYPQIVFDCRSNGSGSMFRLARDTRFSKDKSPYKTNLGLRFWLSAEARQAGRVGLYLHLDKSGVRVYGGTHRLSSEELAAFRVYAADEQHGARLRENLATLEKQGFGIEGEQLMRLPRGYAIDHPCADLLRYKNLFALSPKIDRDSAQNAGLIGLCLNHAAALKPLNDWFIDALPPLPAAD
ncbi:MAG: DUF2461 domain-containing protein [Methylomonas sp.]|nr:DUF2461 domain-containing protein [Methylomonas sp.]